jgi:hypothetical protein
MLSLNRVLAAVAAEHGTATGKFPPINTPHEGKAVIEEELDELWLEIKANRGSSPKAMQEAIQVAAMAVRYVCDLGDTL